MEAFKNKLTPWFPGAVEPVRNGVYKTYDPDLKTEYYNWFHDGVWYYGNRKAADAKMMEKMPIRKVSRWRGLTECFATGA